MPPDEQREHAQCFAAGAAGEKREVGGERTRTDPETEYAAGGTGRGVETEDEDGVAEGGHHV